MTRVLGFEELIQNNRHFSGFKELVEKGLMKISLQVLQVQHFHIQFSELAHLGGEQFFT